VVLNKAHLYAAHGATFRDCIRLLTNKIFRVVFSRTSDQHNPLLLAMTATMTPSIAALLVRLTSIPWRQPCHQLWSSAAEFWRLHITFDFELTVGVRQVALPKIVNHLKVHHNSSVFFFFVNNVGDCQTWPQKLSKQLTLANFSIFVLKIHGEMDKNEKFMVTRLFTNAAHLVGMEPQVLVGMLAENTIIDLSQLEMVSRAGPSQDIVTGLQELGRNCRKDGMHGCYFVYFSWPQVLSLVLTILLGRKHSARVPH